MEAVVELPDYEAERGKPIPSKNHAIIQSNLLVELTLNYRGTYQFLSEISLENPRAVPDVAIFSPMPYDPLHDEVRLNQIPLGVIEIMSPSQTQDELIDKAEAYFQAGVQSYWLVNPVFRIVHILHSRDEYTNVTEGTLTDSRLNISLPLANLFQ
ncbi:Uma2 family endonuclease [Spirosoma rhododendri]|uniref:Uma2 family endonuclease n=1 Tax=Spirosoma rhododendri TaxID=2728024 RepID=A0A7L5DS68_9BACT|nr:Uma2 family endonuclease [Spirosoma rhododendri]QJD78787.1 Uma2 family endonuclease [Spirosoma rhododendri]